MSKSVIHRIRKAMALAEDQAGTPEGETAARIARDLMRAHAIASADLELTEEDPLVEVELDVGKRSQWRRDLAHRLAEHCEVFSLQWSGRTTISLYGRASAVEVTEYLYAVVLRQVEGAVGAYVAALAGDGVWATVPPGRKRSLRNSFCRSAVWTFGQRLQAMRTQEAEASPQSTALMRRRRDEARAFAQDQGQSWRSGSASSCLWSAAGGSAGESIQISPALRSARGLLPG